MPEVRQTITVQEGSSASNITQIAQQTNFYEHPKPPRLTPLQRRTRNRLLTKVRQDWIKGLLEKSLHGEALIALGLEYHPEAVENPWEIIVQRPGLTDRLLPPGTPFSKIFDEFNGRLLILGTPGSGKTTMLLDLTRTLIQRAEKDETEPAPVVLILSSWTHQRKPIFDWLIDELDLRYHIPPKVSRAWIKDGRILPLLDGLDEVSPECRMACVQALNSFIHDFAVPGLVVCSRTADYEILAARFKLETAVVLQPLTVDQIDRYLARGDSALNTLRNIIHHDSTLQELAGSPLMLSIMVIAYSGIPSESLASLTSVDDQRTQLFHIYVQQMFQRRGVNKHYPREQVERWLSWLAHTMKEQGQTVLQIEHIQPDWLPTIGVRSQYDLAMRLMVGTVVALVFTLMAYNFNLHLYSLIYGLLAGMFFGLFWERLERPNIKWAGGISFGLSEGIVYGIALGLLVEFEGLNWTLRIGIIGMAVVGFAGIIEAGLVSGFVKSAKIEVFERLEWTWKAVWRRGLVSGLMVGLIAFLTLNFNEWVGVSVAITTTLLFGLTPKNEEKLKKASGIIIRWLLQNATRWGITFGLLYGLAIGVPTGFYNLRAGIQLGVVYGLSAVIVLGMILGGFAVVQHFILRFVFYGNGLMPWKFIRFLDYAADRLFLRNVGGGYIFIHRYLLEHFAALESAFKPVQIKSKIQLSGYWLRLAMAGALIVFMALFVVKMMSHEKELLQQQKPALSVAEIREIELFVKSLEKNAKPVLFGVADTFYHNHILKNSNNAIKDLDADLRNFIAEVKFFNPYDPFWLGTWDYGLIFGITDTAAYSLTIRANGTWELWLEDILGAIVLTLEKGILTNLNASPNGSNIIKLIVTNEKAIFFLNGQFVNLLDVSKHSSLGKVGVFTGSYENARVYFQTTRFEGFSVWSLEP